MNIEQINAQYITNEKGEKMFVVLPFDEFSEIMEDLEDLKAALERKDEPTISHEKLFKKLKEEGIV